ncbi:MAG: hypothetical protein XD52_0756 [bacterium 42_11]|nr:MAG: hypothetical protein XD52_0756 [bacterium 42_11]
MSQSLFPQGVFPLMNRFKFEAFKKSQSLFPQGVFPQGGKRNGELCSRLCCRNPFFLREFFHPQGGWKNKNALKRTSFCSLIPKNSSDTSFKFYRELLNNLGMEKR